MKRDRRSAGRRSAKPKVDRLDQPLGTFCSHWGPAQLETLNQAGVYTPRDMIMRKESGLYVIKGVGFGTIDKARHCLKQIGVKLEKGEPMVSFAAVTMLTQSEHALVELLSERVMRRVRLSGEWREYVTKGDIVKAGIAALSLLSDKKLTEIMEDVGVRPMVAGLLEGLGRNAEVRPRLERARRGPVIDYVLSQFDFEQIEGLAQDLGWRWPLRNAQDLMRVGLRRPRALDLRNKAEELLQEVLTTGAVEARFEGLRASRIDGHLRLSVEVVSHDDRIPEKVERLSRRIPKNEQARELVSGRSGKGAGL